MGKSSSFVKVGRTAKQNTVGCGRFLIAFFRRRSSRLYRKGCQRGGIGRTDTRKWHFLRLLGAGSIWRTVFNGRETVFVLREDMYNEFHHFREIETIVPLAWKSKLDSHE